MNRVMFSSNSQDWETPQPLFDTLNSKYHFTLDAAASPSNTKCAVYFDEEQDGLSQNWGGAYCLVQSSIWQTDWALGEKSME